jgi:hypothetical protein
MILGATTPGQSALGGAGGAAAVRYIDCAASIAIVSGVQAALSIAGRIDLAASIAIQSAVNASIAITAPIAGEVRIAGTIAIASAITAAIEATQTFPAAGVSFTLSDKAGGA